jgi:hypothetical protein
MSAWGILEGIIGNIIVRYVFPLIGGLLMFLWVRHKENLWRAALAGLVCYTCLLVISSTLISNYNELSKQPIPVAYEEISVPSGEAVGLPAATLNDLISRYGDNLSGWIFVQGNTIAFRIDGGIPTTATAQQLMVGSILTIDSVAALKNFRAIAISSPATIAVNYCKGRVR